MSLRHVEQRLSERALPAAADRGFALLRDAGSLAKWIERLRGEHEALRDAGEIALPLAEGEAPPRLVVTREGRGVTCLGPGMSTTAPGPPFDEVQAFLDARGRARQTRAVLAREEQKDESLRALPRAVELAYRLTRSELDDVRALGPLVGPGLFARCVAEVDEVYGYRKQLKRWPLRSANAAEAAWRRYTAACVSLYALDEHPALEQLCFSILATGDAQLTLRALWLLANRPERTFDALDEVLADPEKPPVAGLLPLCRILACRFPDLRARGRRILHNAVERGDLEEAAVGPLDEDVEQPAFTVVLLSVLPLLLERFPPRELREPGGEEAFKARAEEAMRLALTRGLGLSQAAEHMGPWAARIVELLDPGRHLRARQAHRRASRRPADKPERIRQVLWRSMIRDLRMPALGLPAEALAFLTAAPLDAVLPPARPDVLWRLSAGRAYMQQTLPRILAQAG